VLGELRGDLGSCFEMLGHATLPNAAWGGAQLNASVNTIRLACPVPKKSRSNPQTARQKQEGTRGRWGIEQRENQGKMTPELFKKKSYLIDPYWYLLAFALVTSMLTLTGHSSLLWAGYSAEPGCS
jgi:hypothetical protein